MGRCDTTAPAEARRFGAWVKKMLRKRGLTQAEFADSIGMNVMNLNCILNGHSDLRLTTAIRIARGFGLRIVFAPIPRGGIRGEGPEDGSAGQDPREEEEG